MSFFPVRISFVLFLFALTLFSVESTKAQERKANYPTCGYFHTHSSTRHIGNRSRYLNDFSKDRYSERLNDEDSEPEMDLDPETLEQARRTISHLSPATRRFLFSPTIQNTITNLNHNTNTQELLTGGNNKGPKTPKRDEDSEQLLGYLNNAGEVEYNLKGKVKKVCFILS